MNGLRFIFIVMFLLNLFLISADSSGAVPFGTMLFVVLLWFLINAPLTVIGGLIGKKHGVSLRLNSFSDEY